MKGSRGKKQNKKKKKKDIEKKERKEESKSEVKLINGHGSREISRESSIHGRRTSLPPEILFKITGIVFSSVPRLD